MPAAAASASAEPDLERRSADDSLRSRGRLGKVQAILKFRAAFAPTRKRTPDRPIRDGNGGGSKRDLDRSLQVFAARGQKRRSTGSGWRLQPCLRRRRTTTSMRAI